MNAPTTWKCGHCGEAYGLEVPLCAPCVMLATNPYRLVEAPPDAAAEPAPPADARLRCVLDARFEENAEPEIRVAMILRARVFDGASEIKAIERKGRITALVPQAKVPEVTRRLLGNVARQAQIELGVGDGEWIVEMAPLPPELS